MKKNVLKLLASFMIICVSYNLHAQGVDFRTITIKEGMDLAKKENKNLFIILGTTHCSYSQISFAELYKDINSGKYINEHFISIGYGDSTTANTSLEKWYYSDTRKQLNFKEDELETVLCDYFISPNYFFFNKKGEIVYIRPAPRSSLKILKYAKAVNNGKIKTPFLFKYAFNNEMYSKNKETYKMLSHCLNAYVLMDVPINIDYKNDSIFNLNDFNFTEKNLNKAKSEIELSLQYTEYYFNCFLASIINYQLGDIEKALFYATKGLNDYPKHWDTSRKLPDKLMKDILNQQN